MIIQRKQEIPHSPPQRFRRLSICFARTSAAVSGTLRKPSFCSSYPTVQSATQFYESVDSDHRLHVDKYWLNLQTQTCHRSPRGDFCTPPVQTDPGWISTAAVKKVRGAGSSDFAIGTANFRRVLRISIFLLNFVSTVSYFIQFLLYSCSKFWSESSHYELIPSIFGSSVIAVDRFRWDRHEKCE